MKVLIFTNQLLNTCGVSKHILYMLEGFRSIPDFKFSILVGGGNALDRYRDLCDEIIINERINHENRSYLNYVTSIMNLILLLKKKNFDIVHSHNHYSANISAIACRISRRYAVQSVHGIIPEIGRLNHYPIKNIISVNEHIIDYFSQNNLTYNKNINLIRYGIPELLKLTNKVDKRIRILAASRLIFEKGLDLYFNAISNLSYKQRNKCEFLIAGEGNFEPYLNKMSYDNRLHISFLGDVQDLREILNSTDIFVMPTRSASEGFPLAIIEAGLAKNLLITSNFRGYDSIIKKMENAIVFQNNNWNDLTLKLEMAINNYEKFRYLRENLYREVKEKFDLQNMIKKHIEFYNSLYL